MFQYPTFSSMACDYLAIQGSGTPLERAFSSGGTTRTAKHNCLSAKAFEALQLLKSTYQNEHVGAHLEAQKHTIHLLDVFQTNGDVKSDGNETNSEWLN